MQRVPFGYKCRTLPLVVGFSPPLLLLTPCWNRGLLRSTHTLQIVSRRATVGVLLSVIPGLLFGTTTHSFITRDWWLTPFYMSFTCFRPFWFPDQRNGNTFVGGCAPWSAGCVRLLYHLVSLYLTATRTIISVFPFFPCTRALPSLDLFNTISNKSAVRCPARPISEASMTVFCEPNVVLWSLVFGPSEVVGTRGLILDT